jgi:hypothetical protein
MYTITLYSLIYLFNLKCVTKAVISGADDVYLFRVFEGTLVARYELYVCIYLLQMDPSPVAELLRH